MLLSGWRIQPAGSQWLLSLATFALELGFSLDSVQSLRRNYIFSTLTECIQNISPTCHNLRPLTFSTSLSSSHKLDCQLAGGGVLATPLRCSWLQRSYVAITNRALIRVFSPECCQSLTTETKPTFTSSNNITLRYRNKNLQVGSVM